ncbi:hypothetical protein DIZ27_21345 [Streptomyces sp. NWU339]|uniref:hypothetical protein n=1 Tax=Streptomyces sp. NWU339 TaxID=2185284 RepID=UPI000D68037A|nr:hypothetical protein [Streptomyces sp. NWU339]PWI08729.1 hypothetical protein DIZ27_21345 [Streptomyces sp. NWU339]
MRQTRRTQIEKRRLPARARRYADETAPFLGSFDPFDSLGPFDPRDPAIVRAKRLRARLADDHGRTGRS